MGKTTICSDIRPYNLGPETNRYITRRLLIGFFLSNLDVTIVSSSLTTITDSLEGFEKRSWIITGYLATYTGTKYYVTPDVILLFLTLGYIQGLWRYGPKAAISLEESIRQWLLLFFCSLSRLDADVLIQSINCEPINYPILKTLGFSFRGCTNLRTQHNL